MYYRSMIYNNVISFQRTIYRFVKQSLSVFRILIKTILKHSYIIYFFLHSSKRISGNRNVGWGEVHPEPHLSREPHRNPNYKIKLNLSVNLFLLENLNLYISYTIYNYLEQICAKSSINKLMNTSSMSLYLTVYSVP